MEEFCCDDIKETIEGELIDTRNGYTFRDVYVCEQCQRVFEIEYGERTHGTRECEELYGSDRDEYLSED